jgi:hypothetical protein
MKALSGLRCRRGPSAVVLVAVLTASRADAQPRGAAAQQPDPVASSAESEARIHFDRGVTFYNEADYPAALVEFKRAYNLAPTWQVLFNIGQSYFQIRNYAKALVTLSRFIDEGNDRIPEARRAMVETERADLANRVGHAKITSNRAGAVVTIDGEEVGVAPLREPALVSVGLRKVKAMAPGLPPIEEEVSVSAGDTVDVHFDFPEAQAPPPPAPAPTPAVSAPLAPPTPQPPNVSSVNHVPALAAFGVAVAGAAVGAVFGGMVLRDKSRLEAECNGKACTAGSQPDIDAVSRDGMFSTIGFGVCAVGAVVGTVLWITAGHSHGEEARSGAQVGPVRLGPGVVGGSF